MEPRIKNGFLRAIIFMPLWLIIMGLVQSIGVVLIMMANVVDMGNPDSAEALFSEMSFDSPVMLILTGFSLLGSFAALWVATKFIDRKPLMSIGLSVKDKANEMLIGLGFALAFIGGLFLVLWLIGAINITGYVGFKPGVFIVSIMLFMAAFDEELIFRGYILNNMMDSTSNRWIALAGSSLLFALLHSGNTNVWSTWVPMTELFAAGFILGISYTFTKNLWFPTFFHFGWNFFQGLFGFEISGFNVDSWKIISHENTGNVPDIVSGGAFGIEGSVITLSCTIICTYLIFKYYNELDK
jgi:membrane protease YdiL (CAAX protease family)|tara:strand:+ start:832 stop:1725 length:894 start_codon:yes stop_codon:yes gene_type:complete